MKLFVCPSKVKIKLAEALVVTFTWLIHQKISLFTYFLKPLNSSSTYCLTPEAIKAELPTGLLHFGIVVHKCLFLYLNFSTPYITNIKISIQWTYKEKVDIAQLQQTHQGLVYYCHIYIVLCKANTHTKHIPNIQRRIKHSIFFIVPYLVNIHTYTHEL